MIIKPATEPTRTKYRLGVLALSLISVVILGNTVPIASSVSGVVEISEFLFQTKKRAHPNEKVTIELALPEIVSSMDAAASRESLDVAHIQLLPRRADDSFADHDAMVFEDHETSHHVGEAGRSDSGPLEGTTDSGGSVHKVTVERGDSLYNIFNSLGIPQRDLIELTKGEGRQLREIHPGQVLAFHIGNSGDLEGVIYEKDEVHSTRFIRSESGYDVESIAVSLDAKQAVAHGRIESSLFLAGQAAGLPDKTIMEMAEIFGWDVDFALDIRAGDQFSVIYEELYRDGRKILNGPILAAEFVNRGRAIRAIRYTDVDGYSQYFSPEGKSMRKAFLRTPVKFSRISSYFGKRKHPILHTFRDHKGVDYAATYGTPVKATGDGKIELAGRQGGYGNTIIVRHGNMYTTLYAHLSKFAKGIRANATVRQGQIIGYVGSSGLATGPHLHYEFRVRGVHRNPLKVELPEAEPIAPQYFQDFKDQTGDFALHLDNLARTQIASNE